MAPGEMELLIAADIDDAQVLRFAAGTLGRIEDNGAYVTYGIVPLYVVSLS